jgi:hypothetical protein
MSSTHRHLLLDFFWQVISGPPCIFQDFILGHFFYKIISFHVFFFCCCNGQNMFRVASAQKNVKNLQYSAEVQKITFQIRLTS